MVQRFGEGGQPPFAGRKKVLAGGGGELGRGQACLVGEQLDVHGPLGLGTGQSEDAEDQDFPIRTGMDVWARQPAVGRRSPKAAGLCATASKRARVSPPGRR